MAAPEQTFLNRSLGTACPPTLLVDAAMAPKAWVLLPINTKQLKIPHPQIHDFFRVSKKRETQLAA